MKITIFGASGSVGRYLIDEAVSRGHEVVAVTRSPGKIQAQHIVTEAVVDYTNIKTIEASLKGSDAAIISLGDFNVAQPTENIIQAMKNTNVKRIELLTGFGTSPESRRMLNPAMRTVVNGIRLATHAGFASKEKQDKSVRNSGLSFTIVQPPTLTFGDKTSNYRYGNYEGKSIMGNISRADLADFMINNLDDSRYINESVYVQQ
ncbi:NAD(P)-dependent oxidoreductase [Companilactobacillus jidongensis]|uniref:NAD(P)-dependent oxidoreductase n=1 Tax=Companilactobacillus jidongensis TaxID=2486006 RepID=UPI000F795DF7|nr:NAD(P)H-binding protein [Companilactobacillus jidongensis]